MKYIVLPVLRLLLVVIAIAFAPVLIVLSALASLWDWDKKHLVTSIHCYTQCFISQPYTIYGKQYWYYKTPWDYLLRRRSVAIKNHKTFLV